MNKIAFYKNEIGALLVIILLYIFFHITGIGCPIKYITGISCVGCGMTRAWISLLKLDIKQAFYYHPAFCAPLVALVIFAFRKKIGTKAYNIIMSVIVVAMIAVYLYRLLYGKDDIVVFDIRGGLLYRCFRYLEMMIKA